MGVRIGTGVGAGTDVGVDTGAGMGRVDTGASVGIDSWRLQVWVFIQVQVLVQVWVWVLGQVWMWVLVLGGSFPKTALSSLLPSLPPSPFSCLPPD